MSFIEWEIKITDKVVVACVIALLLGMVLYFLLWIGSYQVESMLFEDMDDARRYQRECLERGNSARVKEHITGIEIVCEGRDRP